MWAECPTGKHLVENPLHLILLMFHFAGGRRSGITLNSILQVATGADEEPLLGFKIHPCIEFTECESFLSTAYTCIKKVTIPRPSNRVQKRDYFHYMTMHFLMHIMEWSSNVFDSSFCNISVCELVGMMKIYAYY